MDEDKKIECTLVTADGKPVLSNSIELKPDSTSPDVLKALDGKAIISGAMMSLMVNETSADAMKALDGKASISCTLSRGATENLMRLSRGEARIMRMFNDAFMYALKMLMYKPADVEDNQVKAHKVAMQGRHWIAYPAWPLKVWCEQGSGKTRREALTDLCIRLEKRKKRMCANVDTVIRNAMRLILTGKEDKSK